MYIKDLNGEFYQQLSGKRLLIFVNYDVDALCGATIITTLLKYENISHTVVPAIDQQDLVQSFEQHKRSAKYVLFINCGGSFDVVDLLDPDEEQVFFIADSHRPIDVHNIYRDNVKLLMKEEDSEKPPTYDDLFRDSDDEDEPSPDIERRFTLEELERRKELREWRQKREILLFQYSQYSYFGEPTSLLFFNLAWVMSKDSNEFLWLTIVGIFDLYNNTKIEESKLSDYVETLKNHLQRLSHLRNDKNLFEGASNVDDVLNVPVGQKSCISIEHKQDLQLICYRHWTLFESFKHTTLTACKFRIWTLSGGKKLAEFLAELGIPLTQCKQNYAAMEYQIRNSLIEWIEDLVEKYTLDGIIGDTFMASYGFKHKFNAADAAFGLSALLELVSRDLSPKEKFIKALEALSWQNTDLLKEGIEACKAQYQAILKQVHDILEMRVVKSGGPFIYVEISETSVNAKFFSYPSCLSRFARFLLEAYVAAQRKKNRQRLAMQIPLVVISTDLNDPSFCLAAGIPPMTEESPANIFTQVFLQASKRLRTEFQFTFYDSSVIKFDSGQKSNLIDCLTSLLS